jgi:hypothetical protein
LSLRAYPPACQSTCWWGYARVPDISRLNTVISGACRVAVIDQPEGIFTFLRAEINIH